jgi:hypothetical protein
MYRLLYNVSKWVCPNLQSKPIHVSDVHFCNVSSAAGDDYVCLQLRGIQVGSVLNVQPHLDRVDVLIQVDDENTVIPRNSRLFANQSGLIAEPLVDIMPQYPIPDYEASPLADNCKCDPLHSLSCLQLQ